MWKVMFPRQAAPQRYINDLVDAAIGVQVIGLYRQTTLAIPSSVVTNLTAYNSTQLNPAYFNVDGSGFIRCLTSGWHRVTASVVWAANAGGTFRLRVWQGGGDDATPIPAFGTQQVTISNVGAITQSFSYDFLNNVALNYPLYIDLLQTTGASINICPDLIAAGLFSTGISVEKLN